MRGYGHGNLRSGGSPWVILLTAPESVIFRSSDCPARLSCRRFAANAVRLQLHALAYNLANFLRTLTLPEAVSHWSMTTLRDRLVKIGAKIVRHGRSITFQMAEVMVSRGLFQEILDAIAALRPVPAVRC